MRAASATLVLLALLLAWPSPSPAAPDRPNILWLVAEDSTTTFGCYGDRMARTPTIDRLAREGVLFERCFTQPVCAPSRFALITGMHPASCGPAEHMRAHGNIPASLRGFPAFLREAGYWTSNNAKTDYNAPINIKDAWDEAGKNAHPLRRPDAKRPFFSVFNHEATHESCLFPERDAPPAGAPATDPAQVRLPPYQPDTPEIRADWARHYNRLAAMDGQVEAKLRDLEKAGEADNTIVFFYGDNGGVVPRSKRFLQASGTHVPLVVYFPPKWRHLAPGAPGARIKDPVCFVDFAPTVLSLAGVKAPAHFQGRAFAGPAQAVNEFVFCSRDRMDERYDMMRSVMDRRWLYIRNFRPDLPYVQPLDYMFRARGYQSWARAAREGKLTPATAMFWGPKPAEELYDLDNDHDNVRNLAGDAAHAATLARMRAALRAHALAIVDNGLVPEGSALEGHDASRAAGAWPVERVFDLATLASDRDAAHLAKLVAALEDPSEPVRWWGAQGCAMLREKAAPAEAALRARLKDPSGAVQIAAAEALARMGRADEALPVLVRWIGSAENRAFACQAGNVLDRLGEAARPALPGMKRFLEAREDKGGKGNAGGTAPRYPHDIVAHAVAVLEGRTQALVYPVAVPAAAPAGR